MTNIESSEAVQTDALRAGADVFIAKPLTRSSLLHAVDSLVGPAEAVVLSPPRRWPRLRLVKSFESRMADTEVRVLDISYGGVRVEVAASPPRGPGELVRLQILEPPLSVYVRPVWQQESAAGTFACGAEIVDPDPSAPGRWRTFVDSVGAA